MKIYDKIGSNYSIQRKPDPRIESIIHAKLRGASKIVNIGAGTGSYEPKNCDVTSVEPSETMILQRPIDSSPVIQAYAENLPFIDKEFECAMALLTIHHWSNLEKGLMEMKRVSNRQLIFTWNPLHEGFWLTQDYFPEIHQIDQKNFPSINTIEELIGPVEVTSVEIPFDCTDGFGSAFWRKPEAYLSMEIRLAMSTFHKISNVEEGVLKLKNDIDSGEWERKYGYLLNQESLDLGFVVLTT